MDRRTASQIEHIKEKAMEKNANNRRVVINEEGRNPGISQSQR
jgi:hypothetical protein